MDKETLIGKFKDKIAFKIALTFLSPYKNVVLEDKRSEEKRLDRRGISNDEKEHPK